MDASSDEDRLEAFIYPFRPGTPQRNPFAIDSPADMKLSAQQHLGPDMEQLRGDNMTSGTLGFGSDAVSITTLVDISSDMTFVSKKILKKL
jgi:hypothetical protein